MRKTITKNCSTYKQFIKESVHDYLRVLLMFWDYGTSNPQKLEL